MVELLKMEPNDNEFLAIRILFENNPFSDNLQDLEVIRRMEEASDESPNLACWVNRQRRNTSSNDFKCRGHGQL